MNQECRNTDNSESFCRCVWCELERQNEERVATINPKPKKKMAKSQATRAAAGTKICPKTVSAAQKPQPVTNIQLDGQKNEDDINDLYYFFYGVMFVLFAWFMHYRGLESIPIAIALILLFFCFRSYVVSPFMETSDRVSHHVFRNTHRILNKQTGGKNGYLCPTFQ
jgi:hypothetical protein